MAIRQKSTLTIKLSGTGIGHARSDIAIRDLSYSIDEPIERGGTNTGFSPTEMVYAALIGCTNVIGHKCAEKLGVNIGNLAFEMEVDFDRRGVLLVEEVEVPFKAIRLAVTSDGTANQEDLGRVAEETEKFCAVSKLYKNSGTEVTVTWTKR
jgi:putative redox protein